MEADAIELGYEEDLSSFLDLLPGYDPNWQTIALLDVARQIWDADNYYPLLVPFPGAELDTVLNSTLPAAGSVFQTFSGEVNVPPFSILTKITFFSSAYGNGIPATLPPFKLRIYDEGGQDDMIFKQFALVTNVASSMATPQAGFQDNNNPFGPYYLLEKRYVMPPGSLRIELTDLSGTTNTCQICMNFAVPKTPRGLNRHLIVEG